MKKCQNCKNEIKEEDIFCENCGSKTSFSTTFTAEPTIKLEKNKSDDIPEKPFYKNTAFVTIFLLLAIIALASIFSEQTKQNIDAPSERPEQMQKVLEPTIQTTPSQTWVVTELSSAEKNQKLMMDLISPLISKYNYLIKTIDNQLPYWESLSQKYTSTAANLQKLQSVYWRNDVQGVIDQLSYEKELTTKYIDLAKARQGYARGMIGGLNSAYQTYGAAPFDSEFVKIVDDDTNEINGYISQYDMNNINGVTPTLKDRSEKNDVVIKALFQRLQNS